MLSDHSINNVKKDIIICNRISMFKLIELLKVDFHSKPRTDIFICTS